MYQSTVSPSSSSSSSDTESVIETKITLPSTNQNNMSINTTPAHSTTKSNNKIADETTKLLTASSSSSSSSSSLPSSVVCSSCSAVVRLPASHYILNATPYKWLPPRNASKHKYRPHQGEGSQYLRDFILGVNDGLVSTLLLVVGMVGGGASSEVALLSGIVCMLSGSIAMGIGEYIATSSQNEVILGEKKLEREHFKYHRDVEVGQLRDYLKEVGIEEGPLLEAVVSKIAPDDELLMKVMERFEFGESSEDLARSPFTAMLMSGRLFAMGAIPSILPFLQSDALFGLYIAVASCGVCLFFVGAYKTRTTGGNWLYGGMENLIAGALGAGISFGIGKLFDEFYINKLHTPH